MIKTFPPGCAFKIIRSAAQSHRSGGAAELREGHAAHVRAKAHQIDQVRVQRRNHEAGAGHGDDQIDFVRRRAGALQTLFSRLAAELDGVLDVFLVGFRKRRGSTV